MSGILGIGITDNLRKYSSVPLIHGKVMKKTNHEIMGKFKNKLSSWKSNCLILVKRATSIRLVNVTTPTYLMAIALLPKCH